MEFLRKLFGKEKEQVTPPPEHAVIVHFEYGQTDLSPLFQLEDELEKVINNSKTGEFDGNEIATDGSDGHLYMYGPDADLLFAAVQPVLKNCKFIKNAVAKLRYGPPEDGVHEKEIQIGS